MLEKRAYSAILASICEEIVVAARELEQKSAPSADEVVSYALERYNNRSEQSS